MRIEIKKVESFLAKWQNCDAKGLLQRGSAPHLTSLLFIGLKLLGRVHFSTKNVKIDTSQ